MSKKNLTYFLIVIVAVVWGNIFYRIFFYMKNSGKQMIEDTFIAPALPQNSNDTFSICANYPDPFLAPVIVKPNIANTKVVKKAPVVKTTPIPTVWPGIVYNGMIKNQHSEKQLAIVVVNGQSNIMRTGDSYMDVTISKLYRDSVEVSYKNIKKVIHK